MALFLVQKFPFFNVILLEFYVNVYFLDSFWGNMKVFFFFWVFLVLCRTDRSRFVQVFTIYGPTLGILQDGEKWVSFMGFCLCFVVSVCYRCNCCSRVDAGVLQWII